MAGCSKCALIMETTAVTELQDTVKVAEMVESNHVGYSSHTFWIREWYHDTILN